MSAKKERFTENEVIEIARRSFQKTSKNSPYLNIVATGLGDDCFSFTPPENKKVVITKDALFEDVHFRKKYFSYFDIGYRAVSVNFSDLSSQGAEPAFIFIALGISGNEQLKDIEELFAGIEEACLECKAVVAGGDTSLAQKLTISITAVGFCEREMKRSGANPGDLVCVTGELGLAAAGFYALENSIQNKNLKRAVERFLRPKPRILEGLYLSSTGVSCCEDISDGLLRELLNIARESRVGIEVEPEKIPVAKELYELGKFIKDFNPLKTAVSFGDDYELVFTVNKKDYEKIKDSDIGFSVIGKVTDEEGKLHFPGLDAKKVSGYLHTFNFK